MLVLTVGILPVLAGIAILAMFAAWWAHRLETGAPFRPILEMVSIAVYLAIFCLVESGTWFGFGSTAPADLVILGGAGLAAALYTFDGSRIVRLPGGQLGYCSGGAIPMAWLFLLWADLAVQVTLLGHVTILNEITIQGIPDPAASWVGGVGDPVRWAAVGVDALFALSTGLLIGQSIGVYACMARLPWSGPATRAGSGRAIRR
jgi:hypothetical protein